MIVYVHSADVADAGRTFSRHEGADVRHLTIQRGVAAGDVATRVLASFSESERSESAGSIDLLVINTHGSPGTIHLGGIEDDDFDINIDNAAEFASPFQPLMKSLLSGGHGVEIHGCGTAGGSLDPVTGEPDDEDVGFRFIYALANGFGTRVRASASPQIPDAEGLFEDTLVEAVPGEDPESFRDHLSLNVNPELVHSGGFLARIEAMFSSMPHDPRDVHIRDDAREPRFPNR